MALRVEAIELYGEVSGASYPRLMMCSDGHFYVVKRPNNRHGRRSLANELLASLLLKQIGITTPEPAIVNCSAEFLRSVGFRQPSPEDSELWDQGENTSGDSWEAGLAFGSRVDPAGWGDARLCPVTWYLPIEMLRNIKNLTDFIDVAVFDEWVCNLDRRQVAFIRPKYVDGFCAEMIDHGMCFGGRSWKLETPHRERLFCQTSVYDSVFGLDAFERVISNIRARCSLPVLKELTNQIPSEWYLNEQAELLKLLKNLVTRQRYLEAFMCGINRSRPTPFKNWNDNWRSHPQNSFSPACFIRVGVGVRESKRETVPIMNGFPD